MGPPPGGGPAGSCGVFLMFKVIISPPIVDSPEKDAPSPAPLTALSKLMAAMNAVLRYSVGPIEAEPDMVIPNVLCRWYAASEIDLTGYCGYVREPIWICYSTVSKARLVLPCIG